MRARSWLCAASLLLWASASAQRVPGLSPMVLRPTLGGVLLDITITPHGGGEELLGVWSAGARSKLLDCTSRCKVVKSIPIHGAAHFNGQTRYRIVLGGVFGSTQSLGVLFSFVSGVASASGMLDP